MLGIRSAMRSKRVAAVMAALLLFALMVPTVASATIYAFKPNQLVNGNGSTGNVTIPASHYPVWLFIGNDLSGWCFMTDADGWGMKPLDGSIATPVPYRLFRVAGYYEAWSCLGFDVRNTGSSPIDITVTATAGGSPVSQVVSIDPGIEHVNLAGFTNIASGSQMQIDFALSSDLSFNNFDLVTFSATAPPTVSTGTASSISSSGATVAGNVTDAGGTSVTERGICYSTTGTPTISGPKVAAGTGAGAFTATLSGLSPSTTYNVRSYATNSNGTSYGETASFTTAAAPPAAPPTVSVDASSPWSIAILSIGALGAATVMRRRVSS